MKKVYVTWNDVEGHVQEIVRQMQIDNWRPDYIVGITRGGLVPANLISQYLEIPMHALGVSLRDASYMGPESNLWMAEDAFGYAAEEYTILQNAGKSDPAFKKNILIVDDINDSGATINWIRQDWQKSCLPNDPAWADVWNNNVRIAVVYDNLSSAAEISVDYSSVEVNKHDDPCWIVFPWEDWWQR